MSTLIGKLLKRYRPRIGWPQFALALGAALCPAFAAQDSKLTLPAAIFGWAGVLGLLIGLRMGRTTDDRRPTTHRALRFALRLAIVLGGAALLIVAAGKALPPFGLIVQDAAALATWSVRLLRRAAGWSELPQGRTWQYLATSIPRYWRTLLNAPSAGERGAALMVAAGGVVATWIGALALGWALAGRRSLYGWSLPMLAAIALTAILNGGTGAMLIFGLALLLVLTITASFARRRRAWDRAGVDYSDELSVDVLAWGGGIAVVTVMLAAFLPTSLSNPLTDLFWRDVELPSGIAVLERNIPRPQPSKVDVGLSTLPALQLGQSLEQPPPSEVILRIRPEAPFKPSPWPHYWRARVFNLYTGREWTTNARVGTFARIQPVSGAVPGTIVQEVEDLRDSREILVGLADVLGVDVDVQAERLPDGDLAALTEQGAGARYRVISRPQELASPPPADSPPPDMRSYLGLPRSYPPRVGDLARVVAGGAAPYDQALALEKYLRELPYSYQVQPLPGGGDAVEQFLFDMRQGYCTYYASAMAVMARTLGIPARVAVGYATGQYDQPSGAYLVRQSDAHAWPELYIGGRWLPFEPTPIRALPARSATEAIPSPAVATAPAEQPAPLTGPLIWAATLAIVALLTALGIWLGRRRPRPLVAQVQERLERGGAQAGVAWPAGATLHEYGALLAPHAGDATGDLGEVVDLVARARYSGRPLRGDQEGRLRAAAERVLARLRRRQ